MQKINPDELWFNTPDTFSLCRVGGNGPLHPSQLYAVDKYIIPLLKKEISFLDYGMGSGTTYEALKLAYPVYLNTRLKYRGVDIIPKNVKWCQETFPEGDFVYNPSIHKIDQPDKSFDVVYSRHVVDHMRSFEEALDEHFRVARKFVIVILWVALNTKPEHEIKNIIEGPLDNRHTYKNEYTNRYSREKVMDYLQTKKDWKLIELKEGILNADGGPASNDDVCFVLKHE